MVVIGEGLLRSPSCPLRFIDRNPNLYDCLQWWSIVFVNSRMVLRFNRRCCKELWDGILSFPFRSIDNNNNTMAANFSGIFLAGLRVRRLKPSVLNLKRPTPMHKTEQTGEPFLLSSQQQQQQQQQPTTWSHLLARHTCEPRALELYLDLCAASNTTQRDLPFFSPPKALSLPLVFLCKVFSSIMRRSEINYAETLIRTEQKGEKATCPPARLPARPPPLSVFVLYS